MSKETRLDDGLREYGLSVFEEYKCQLTEDQLNRVAFALGEIYGNRAINVVPVRPPVTVLSNVRYIVVVDEDQWYGLSDETKKGLLHHQMNHIPTDPENFEKGCIVSHDLNDFRIVVEEHGPLYECEQ